LVQDNRPDGLELDGFLRYSNVSNDPPEEPLPNTEVEADNNPIIYFIEVQ